MLLKGSEYGVSIEDDSSFSNIAGITSESCQLICILFIYIYRDVYIYIYLDDIACSGQYMHPYVSGRVWTCVQKLVLGACMHRAKNTWEFK